MTQGTWFNNDGLYLQYGTQKAIPELGGDFKSYGEWREVETYIGLAQTTWGALGGMPPVPALPNGFTGTSTPIAAGIQSMTTLMPLQTTAIPAAAASGNGLILSGTYLWISQVDLEVLVGANAGTGSATGLTGIGLVVTNPGAPSTFVQATPNAGVQLVGATSNAQMGAGKHYTWYSDGTAFGTGSPPTAGSWLGQVPLLTNAITPLPQSAWISALATGGTYSGTTASGLLKLRVKYFIWGNIAN